MNRTACSGWALAATLPLYLPPRVVKPKPKTIPHVLCRSTSPIFFAGTPPQIS